MHVSFQSAWCRRIVIFAAMFAVLTAFAKDPALNYLKAGKPDADSLLPPPPLPGSAEALADLNEVRSVYHAASNNDVQAAYAEKHFSVFSFSAVVGPFFVPEALPKTAAFFAKVQSDAAKVTDVGKDFFKRPRPYTTDPNLSNCKLETSFSYPSGHATETMVIALVLADLLPGQREPILAQARSMGWHRVQIARHYPTDIFAGRTLALAIVKQFKKSDDYQQDFESVKAELASVQK